MIIGTVIDSATAELLADVVVTITSTVLQHDWIVVTNKSGEYRIPDLPPGTYTLQLDKDTYRSRCHSGIQLGFTATLRVDAEMLPEARAGAHSR